VTRSPRTGEPHRFFVLEGNDWVNVVALTSAGEIVLVRQYRAGTESVTLEIPGGGVEDGETPLAAAQRELREETGYTASRWRELGMVHPNPAVQANRCTSFLAEDAVPTGELDQDAGEDLSVELRPATSVGELVRSGEITHGLVLVAFHLWGLSNGQVD